MEEDGDTEEAEAAKAGHGGGGGWRGALVGGESCAVRWRGGG